MATGESPRQIITSFEATTFQRPLPLQPSNTLLHNLCPTHVPMTPAWALSATSPLRPVTYSVHARTMALASAPIERCLATNVTVCQTSTAPTVNWIIAFAETEHAGMRVRCLHACATEQGDRCVTCFSRSAACNVTADGHFACSCTMGWQGIHCQTRINHCRESSCLNNGVCRPVLGNYSCECLGSSYSGRQCEITSTKTSVQKTISRSLAFVAIIALTTVAIFIVVLDVMKYGFGIDVAPQPARRMVRRRRKAKSHVYLRFIYVNAPLETSAVHETALV